MRPIRKCKKVQFTGWPLEAGSKKEQIPIDSHVKKPDFGAAAPNARLEEPEAENTWLKEVEILNGQLKAENALLKAENARVKDLEAENQRLEKLRSENGEKLKSSASLLLKSKDEVATLIQLVEYEKAMKRELAKELRNMHSDFRVKEEEVVFLTADLNLQQDELQRYILKNEGRSEEIVELQNKIRDFDESWGEERKEMVEKLESSASLLLKYSDDQTSLTQLVESEKYKKKELAKELRNLNMSYKVQEEEVVSLNADLKLQQDQLQRYILKNEGRSEEIVELQNKIRDLDERWSTDHKESLEREIKLEDDIKLLIQQNIVLQEQALRTGSFKERVKEEKMEKKEREKEEKMEKKERKKREKEENEGTTRRRFPFLFNFKSS